jgi:putative membrane protein
MHEREPLPLASGGEVARNVEKQAERVRESAAQIEASAGAVERSTDQLTDSADRRTVLAADRTVLAAERTYAAWIRTGLVAFASGLGVLALLDQQLPRWLVEAAAAVMIAFSIFCYATAVWRNLQRVGTPAPDAPRLPLVILVVFSALLILIAGASLIAILKPA